jgi:DNA recombination protein RmuC
MQVVIVSPHVFMLAINTIQSLMRDAKMREQAHKIQLAVVELLQDVKRLGDRVGNLRSHFDRTNKDIAEIETSMKRIESRALKIEQVELALPDEANGTPSPGEPPKLTVIQSGLRALKAAESVPSSR